MALEKPLDPDNPFLEMDPFYKAPKKEGRFNKLLFGNEEKKPEDSNESEQRTGTEHSSSTPGR